MPYHPPTLEWITEEDFAIYKDVAKGAYRFHDMMLERLLDLAGPEATVILCSDHGFESGSQRPHGTPREPAGPAAWHRQYGIFVMAGPGVRHDERIYGASLIDIAPTILTLFDLPIGQEGFARGRGDESAIARDLHPDRGRVCAAPAMGERACGLRKSGRAR